MEAMLLHRLPRLSGRLHDQIQREGLVREPFCAPPTRAAATFASSSPARSKVFCRGGWQEALWTRGAVVSLYSCLPQVEVLVTEDRGDHYQQESGARAEQEQSESDASITLRVPGVLPGRCLPGRRLCALRVAWRQRGPKTCLSRSRIFWLQVVWAAPGPKTVLLQRKRREPGHLHCQT